MVSILRIVEALLAEAPEGDAKKHFGVTHNLREAGWILKDGTMLDFSGRHQGAHLPMAPGQTYPKSSGGRRWIDHREIQDVIAGDWTNAMLAFLKRGNIRVDFPTGMVNTMTRPTAAQMKVLHQAANKFELYAEVSKPNGDSKAYEEFKRGQAAELLAFLDEHSR